MSKTIEFYRKNYSEHEREMHEKSESLWAKYEALKTRYGVDGSPFSPRGTALFDAFFRDNRRLCRKYLKLL